MPRKVKDLFPGKPTASGGFEFDGNYREVFARYLASLHRKKPDAHFAIVVEELKKRRSDDQFGFYHLRKSIIAAATGYRPDELHRDWMEELGLGEYVKLPPRREGEQPRKRFFRESSEEIGMKDYSRLIALQDSFVQWWNDDLPPDKWIVLPKGKKKR